jgi:hypothetical protein
LDTRRHDESEIRAWTEHHLTTLARKAKHPDAWDPPIEPYDPYGPGTVIDTHGEVIVVGTTLSYGRNDASYRR